MIWHVPFGSSRNLFDSSLFKWADIRKTVLEGKRSFIKLDSNEQFEEAFLAKFVFLETQLQLRA